MLKGGSAVCFLETGKNRGLKREAESRGGDHPMSGAYICSNFQGTSSKWFCPEADGANSS